MERDRSLLTVSAAAIGLLVTLLTVGDDAPLILSLFYAVAFLAFATVIVSAISVFERNASYHGACDERKLLKPAPNTRLSRCLGISTTEAPGAHFRTGGFVFFAGSTPACIASSHVAHRSTNARAGVARSAEEPTDARDPIFSETALASISTSHDGLHRLPYRPLRPRSRLLLPGLRRRLLLQLARPRAQLKRPARHLAA